MRRLCIAAAWVKAARARDDRIGPGPVERYQSEFVWLLLKECCDEPVQHGVSAARNLRRSAHHHTVLPWDTGRAPLRRKTGPGTSLRGCENSGCLYRLHFRCFRAGSSRCRRFASDSVSGFTFARSRPPLREPVEVDANRLRTVELMEGWATR
jgi:hypothetical protein